MDNRQKKLIGTKLGSLKRTVLIKIASNLGIQKLNEKNIQHLKNEIINFERKAGKIKTMTEVVRHIAENNLQITVKKKSTVEDLITAVKRMDSGYSRYALPPLKGSKLFNYVNTEVDKEMNVDIQNTDTETDDDSNTSDERNGRSNKAAISTGVPDEHYGRSDEAAISNGVSDVRIGRSNEAAILIRQVIQLCHSLLHLLGDDQRF